MYCAVTSTKQVSEIDTSKVIKSFLTSDIIFFLIYVKAGVNFATFPPLSRYRKSNFRMRCCEIVYCITRDDHSNSFKNLIRYKCREGVFPDP